MLANSMELLKDFDKSSGSESIDSMVILIDFIVSSMYVLM